MLLAAFIVFALAFCVVGMVQQQQAVRRTVEKRRARDLKTRPQVRKSFPPEEDLRALARSVIKRQLHPLIILPGDYILDGECRYRGLMLEHPDFEVDVIVVDRELTPVEIRRMQMISGIFSTSLTSYEQSLGCKELLENTPNATAAGIAQELDRDASTVGKLLSLWRTTPATIKAAAEGKIGVKAWHQISLVREADRDELLEMYLAGTSVENVAKAGRVKRQPATNGTTVRVSRIKCEVPGKNATIMVSGASISLEDMIEAMVELTKLAKRESDKGLDAKTFERVCRDLAKKQ